MSTNALNQVYKHGILAIEESLLTQNETAGAATLHVSGKYMSSTPFVVGQSYVVRDDTFGNSERVQVTSITGLTSIPISPDNIGYTVSGEIGILAYTSTGWSGTLVKNYTTLHHASILTPGMEMAIQSADFNCRFKTFSDAPKIDFDDEASRFASGDEGRDLAVAGARSAEISFTQKMAWAGNFTTKPTWEKVMRATGHIIRTFAGGMLGTAIDVSGSNDVEELILANDFNPGDFFNTTNNSGLDVTSGELTVIKGSALVRYDSFLVGPIKKSLGIAVSPSNSEDLAALILAYSLSPGDMFYTSDGSDTTSPSLLTAKSLHTTIALGVGDSFVVDYAGDTVSYLNQSLTYATAGIEFLPLTSANEVTATVWTISPENGAAPSSTVYRYCGAHGGNGCSIGAGKIGDPYMMTMKLSAAYIGTMEISLANARVLTSPDTTSPEVLLSNTVTVPARVNGSTTSKEIDISQFSLDFGGVINPFIDQSTATGNAYYVTQDRDPRLSVNPYHVRKSVDDVDYVVTNMTAGAATVKSALSYPHITIEVPNAQLMSPALASREGYINTNRVYRCMRNNLGSGAVDSNLPDGAMYSILIGSRA